MSLCSDFPDRESFARPNNPNFKSLYNGNIGGMTMNNAALSKATSGVNAAPLFYNYQYDQLNRLTGMRSFKGFDNATNTWTPIDIYDYREQTSYDPNGNILTYKRYGAPEAGLPKLMDSLTYTYWADKNQLKQVLDDVSYTDNELSDIDNQVNPDNYVYDAIGNLIEDKAENITINWNVYGKIASIVKSNGTITYTYDAAGNRISKTYDGKTTAYVRDGSGNVMSVYERQDAGAITQSEVHLYGSSRLGLVTARVTMPQTGITLEELAKPAVFYTFTKGEKIFELTNHLGNVLATVSDRLVPYMWHYNRLNVATLETDRIYSTANPSTIATPTNAPPWYVIGLPKPWFNEYEADVLTANDYYPGGMQMPGRTVNSDAYRYSVNGQEKTPEIAPNTTTAEFWQYDARIVRRWNVDPVVRHYESPYAAFGNNPILLNDPEGLEPVDPQKHTVQKGDNLTKLAKQYNTTVDNLVKWNSIKNRNVLVLINH